MISAIWVKETKCLYLYRATSCNMEIS